MSKGFYSTEYKRLISRLIRARKQAGLGQVQVAKMLKKAQSHISKIETGQRGVDVIELKKLARIYKKEITYFLQ